MFRAGRASRPGHAWLWSTLTAMLAVTAAGLGTALAFRPEPKTQVKMVYVPVQQPAPPRVVVDKPTEPEVETPPSPGQEPVPAGPNTLQLQRNLLRWGLDG